MTIIVIIIIIIIIIITIIITSNIISIINQCNQETQNSSDNLRLQYTDQKMHNITVRHKIIFAYNFRTFYKLF